MKKNRWQIKKGFTLIETLLYLFFLVILLSAVISLIVSLSKTYQTIKVTRNVESSAIFALERMSRDIRGAESISTGQSTFGTNNGILTLNTTDTSGAAQTLKYYLSGNTIQLDENGSYKGPLSLSTASVTSLSFRMSTTTNSEAVKIEMTVQSTSGISTKTANFYTTVVLRGSY